VRKDTSNPTAIGPQYVRYMKSGQALWRAWGES
jgi:hypothetical protein